MRMRSAPGSWFSLDTIAAGRRSATEELTRWMFLATVGATRRM